MNIFITGGTGYVGRPLIQTLLKDGHIVRGLARRGSEHKLPPGCHRVTGDALDFTSYREQIGPCDTFIHLVGVAHPSPSKTRQFREIDLKSIECAVLATQFTGVRHFIYVSVAHPAPMMRDYIAARSRGEELIRDAGLNATIVRPWYVLGPGHRWPYLLIPAYSLLSMIPATRDGATRLGLVTRNQMVRALSSAVRRPAQGIRIIEVPEIRRLGSDQPDR